MYFIIGQLYQTKKYHALSLVKMLKLLLNLSGRLFPFMPVENGQKKTFFLLLLFKDN